MQLGSGKNTNKGLKMSGFSTKKLAAKRASGSRFQQLRIIDLREALTFKASLHIYVLIWWGIIHFWLVKLFWMPALLHFLMGRNWKRRLRLRWPEPTWTGRLRPRWLAEAPRATSLIILFQFAIHCFIILGR